MKLYRGVISVMFFALAVYVFCLNMFATCFTSQDRFELNFYSGDIIILNIAAVALFVAAVLFIDWRRFSGFLEKHYDVIRIVLYALIALSALLFISGGKFPAGVDQLRVQESVYGMTRGNYEMFSKTQYMDIYPNQHGFALIMYLGTFIFGTYNYLAVRIMNVIFLVLLYHELGRIGENMGLSKSARIVIFFIGSIFLPTTLYTLFIYGNIAGLALSVLAADLMMRAFLKNKISYGIFSLIALFMACVFKSNYMIFGVGIGIYCLFKALSIKDIRKMVFVPFVILMIWLSSFLPLTVMRSITGMELDGGVSYYSYLAMGVQENKPDYAGGFNGFNEDSYVGLGGDKEQHAQYSKEIYSQTIANMLKNPSFLLNFFTRKQLHQWTDPVYKSFWSIQAVSQRDTKPWMYEFISPDFSYPVTVFLSYFQLVIWLGAILYVWLSAKEKDGLYEALVMPMIFIGGFIFHTFWEAKSQYVFPFFVILFPVSIAGFIKLKAWFSGRSEEGREKLSERLRKLNGTKIKWSSRFTLSLFAVIAVFPMLLGIASLREQLAQDRELYKTYMKTGYRQSHIPLDDGIYEIKENGVTYKVELTSTGDNTYMKDVETGLYLTAAPYTEGGDVLTKEAYTGSDLQKFKLYLTDANGLIIVYNDEYIFCSKDGGVEVEYAPLGTILLAEPNEGRTWSYSRAG